jgi:hypothetical protein
LCIFLAETHFRQRARREHGRHIDVAVGLRHFDSRIRGAEHRQACRRGSHAAQKLAFRQLHFRHLHEFPI